MRAAVLYYKAKEFDTLDIYREVWNWSVWDKVLRLMSGCRKRDVTGEWREFCRHRLIGTT